MLRRGLEIALVDRGREGVQLGHRRVVQHAGGDRPAAIGEVGQSRFIAQSGFGVAVLNQCLDDFADEVIVFAHTDRWPSRFRVRDRPQRRGCGTRILRKTR